MKDCKGNYMGRGREVERSTFSKTQGQLRADLPLEVDMGWVHPCYLYLEKFPSGQFDDTTRNVILMPCWRLKPMPLHNKEAASPNNNVSLNK